MKSCIKKPVLKTTTSALISRPLAVTTAWGEREMTVSSWTSSKFGLFIAARYPRFGSSKIRRYSGQAIVSVSDLTQKKQLTLADTSKSGVRALQYFLGAKACMLER